MANLRDRIAAVWLQHDGPYSQYKPDTDLMRLACDCGWVGETDEYQQYADHFADQMIGALGIQYENTPDIAGSQWGVHRRIVSDSTFIPGPRYERNLRGADD